MTIKASKKLMFFLATALVCAAMGLRVSVRSARAQSDCYDPAIAYATLCGGSYTADDDPGDDHPWWYKAGRAGCNAERTYVGWKAKCRYLRAGDGFRCVEFRADQVTEPNAPICSSAPQPPVTPGGDIESRLGWPFGNLGSLITTFLQVATLAAGLLLLVYLILGGIKYITSSGDEKQITSAKGMITSAVVGLVIITAAYAITAIIEKVFGIRIIGGITLPRP